MKKILLVIVLVLSVPYIALAEEEIYNAADSVRSETIENVQKILPDFSFEDTAKQLTQGNLSGKAEGIFENIQNILFGEITSALKTLGAVIVIGAVCSVMTNMQSGFFSGGTVAAISLVCYLMIAGLTVEGFLSVSSLGERAAEDVSTFMLAALPSLGGLGIASGAAISGTAMLPTAIFAAGLCSLIVSKICLPGIYLSLAMSLVSGISERITLKELGALIRKTSLWILTGAVTISVSIIVMSGFATGTLDGVAAKGTKFAVSTLVPVLGGALADAADTVMGSAVILKNAAGAAGMIFVLLMLLYPILKIMVVAVMYKMAGALLSLVADKKISGVLYEMGDTLSSLAGMLIFDGAGMIVMIAAIINISNMGAMMR